MEWSGVGRSDLWKVRSYSIMTQSSGLAFNKYIPVVRRRSPLMRGPLVMSDKQVGSRVIGDVDYSNSQ